MSAESTGSADSGAKGEKYARLAAEYSKLRSHLTVLKKAVADERAKNAESKETIRDRELRLRKSELEVDSLNFRNQQLTKRVTVLQDDIESLQSHKNAKKGKHKKDDREQTSRPSDGLADSVLQEELQKKIIENARLVSQMADREFEISQFRTRVSDLEKSIAESDVKFRSELHKLKLQNQEATENLENAALFKEKSAANVPSGKNNANGDFVSEVGSLIGSEDALSAEESQLQDQLKKKTERLAQVESENQNLKIELDLLKLEVSSLKTTKEAEKNVQTNSNDRTLVVENLIGKMILPVQLSDEVTTREENLKSYFRTKISSLIAEKQEIESSVKYYTDEVDGYKAQLDCLNKEKQSLEDGLQSVQSTIQKLEDELHSTSTNYEKQVNLLTEHVGNLNDKLAEQVEEIQRLKGNMFIK